MSNLRSIFAVLFLSLSISMAAFAAPSITSLTPSTGAVGASITIAGSGFGTTQGTSTIKFNGITATATSWSATSIVATVPTGATTGNVVVTVSGVASSGKSFTVVAAPGITSLSPTSGTVGTSVTITGTNFGSTQGSSTVKFNGTTATPTSWSATSVKVPVPAGATTGNVVVHASGVDSNGSSFTVIPTPSITSLSPTSGVVGASVTITGTNFGATQRTSTVKFNGTTASATSWSATSIVATVPTGATTGSVIVTVSGVASNGSSFTVVAAPGITSLSPTSGTVGTSVTITGTNFGSTQGSSTVKFNGTTATPTSWSATSVKVRVPAGATTGNVVVHASGVDSNGSSFTVLPTPSITSLSPTSGAVGASVTITGTNFGATQGTSTVKFNGTTATATSWSATSVVATVPTGATTGNVVVTVSGVASNGSSFAVVAAPSITSLSPTSGPVGTSVTIAGSNFGSSQGSSTVKFNGTTATPTSWSATSITAPAPSGATTGNVVVHASGVDSNGKLFSVPLGSFAVAGSLNAARFNHTATLLNNGKVLVAAGDGRGTGSFLASAELYDPGTNTFTTTGSLNLGRDTHAAALLNNGSVLITGGQDVNFKITASSELYNPVAGTFTATGSLNTARRQPTATMLNSGLVLVVGGQDGSNHAVAAAELYNPNSGTFTATGSLNTARHVHAATRLNDGTVLITGGADSSGSTLTSAEIYDPALGTFSTVGSLANAREGHSATLLNDGTVLIVGGTNVASAELYNPATKTFSTTGSLTTARANHTGTLLTNGTVLIAGGSPFTGNTLPKNAELYNPATATFVAGANLTTGRQSATATLLANGTVLVAGGADNSSNPIATAELYQPATLTPAGLQSIAITPSNPTLDVGGIQGFVATGTFSGNSTHTLASATWSSSNTAVTTITNDSSNSAQAQAVATGSATVSACAGSVCGSTSVTVVQLSITNISPSSGTVGTLVTISGTGFGSNQGSSTVSFNGVLATPTSWNAVSIQAPVPASATSGNIVVTVGGTSTNSSAFTVVPVIGSLSPNSGIAGTSVTVNGSGFGPNQGTSTITFNGQTANATSWSPTTIVAQAPAGATSGNVVVTVGGVQSNASPFTVLPITYSFHRSITIDHSKVPNTDQPNFPVLISGVYSYLATVSNGGKVQNPNGYDIAFSADAAGATKLDHEIESYDPVTGTLNAWVRVPVLSHATDAVIFLQYGNSAVTLSPENRPGVWDSNYQMVLHLAESASPYRDSTANAFNSTGGVLPVQSPGKVGRGQSFDGTSQYIAYSQSPNPTGAITLETWIKTQPNATFNGIFGKFTNDGTNNSHFSYEMAACCQGSVGAEFNPLREDGAINVFGNNLINDGNWHQVVAAAPPTGTISFYIDGVQTGSTNNTDALLATTTDRLTVGGTGLAASPSFFPGSLDELRISSSVRSADWIATQYNNQNLPATFYAAGQENAPAITSLTPASAEPGAAVTITGNGFTNTVGTVTLNAQSLAISSWSDTSIVVTIPSGAASGPVTVNTGGVLSNGVFFAVVGPTIRAFSPPSAEPGSAVTISGTGFGASTGTVTFGGQTITVSSWSDTSIAIVLPATANSGNMVVSNNGLQSAGTPFTVLLPAISSLSPNSGDPGTPVVIAGADFGAAQGNVTFNGLAATISSWSSSSVTAQVPLGSTAGNVVVTSALGRASNGFSFNVTDDFAVTLLSPATGPAGTTITIDGGGFGATQGSSIVEFNGVSTTVSSWSENQITAVVPVGASTGTVNITTGSGTARSPSPFVVTTSAQITDSFGRSSSYTSSSLGGTWLSSSATGSGCSSCSVRGNVQSSFDASGNRLTFTDELGHVTNYTYDSSANVASQSAQLNSSTPVTTSYTYNSFGEPLTVTDPLGNTTTNTYDGNGNLLTVTTPAPNSSTPASVTQFAYDSKGELTQITDPLNHAAKLTYTPAGLIATIIDAQNNVTTYQYDGHGNRTAVIDALQHQTSFAYDAMDRLTTITYPDQTTAGFAYDSRGRRTSVTDQNGKVTTYTYDDADRLTQVKDAANNVTQYVYDTEGNLLSITDASNHATAFAYDAFGRVTQTTFPSTLVETYLYDAVGNPVSKTDRNGHSILYVYDALNRLTHKGYPDSTGVDYVYDLAGKIKQVTDPTGSYGFAYDNMGRLIGTTTQYSFLPDSPTPIFSNSYGYDAASNRTSFTLPDGTSNSYAYDVLNQMTTLTDSLTGQFGFGYDTQSRRTSLNRPNGVNTSYTYDSLSQLLGVLHKTGTTTLDGANYAYDNAGVRTAKTNQLDGVAEQYVYDALYQLTRVFQGATVTENYTYDSVGNRISSLSVPWYNYNSSNELMSTSAASFAYDNNGNTLSKTSSGATTQYIWDFENRLSSVILPGSGGIVAFKYDPFGRRIQKSSPNGTTNYVYDGANIIEEISSVGALVARYTQNEGVDEPLAQMRSGLTSYYEQDGLGSVTSLSASTGTLVNTYIYDSFGNLITSTGTSINPFQYTGREYDSEAGLRYYRARYYDPANGRFISEDPLGFDGDINFYDYVENEPSGLIDDFGLMGGPLPLTRPLPLPPGRIIPFPAPARPAVGFCARFPFLCGITLVFFPMNSGEDFHAVRCADTLSEPGCAGGHPVPDPNSTNAHPTPCKDKNKPDDPDCEFAGSYRLEMILRNAGARDAHEFKEWFVGKGAKVSRYDICACKDGSVVIKARGQCGKPGPGIDTGIRWK